MVKLVECCVWFRRGTLLLYSVSITALCCSPLKRLAAAATPTTEKNDNHLESLYPYCTSDAIVLGMWYNASTWKKIESTSTTKRKNKSGAMTHKFRRFVNVTSDRRKISRQQ
jgi:hypothetical protein